MATPIYKINGTAIDPQPSNGIWGPRNQLGVDGFNRAIYAPTRSFVIKWDALSFSEYATLYAFYLTVQSSGYVTADLPPFAGTSYDIFTVYTNCVIDELSPGKMENKYIFDVAMQLRNIIA